jgi:glycosyltransferase involved in cell wall biosynthesis
LQQNEQLDHDMKLAILADGVYPFVLGGMQRHSSNVVKYLAARGHEITLVHAVANKAKELPAEEEVREALGIDVKAKFRSIAIRFPSGGWMPGHYIKESYQLSRLIYDRLKGEWQDFDFVYAKGFCAWHLLHLKSKGEKLPPIGVKFHGYEMFQKDADLKSKLQSWMLRGPVKWNNLKADVVFSYGGNITEIIKGIGVKPERIEEVTGAIDSKWLRTNPRTDHSELLRFLFIGRNERRKGIEELHSVIKKLLLNETFEFHFIGPIPNSVRIKNPRVIYHGSISDSEKIISIIDQSDILVTPSYSEGMPNVILEGMARGLAVIATNVGAVNIEVDPACGWLISPGSENELLSAMILALRMDTEVLKQMQETSRRKVLNQFLWPEVALKLEAALLKHIPT